MTTFTSEFNIGQKVQIDDGDLTGLIVGVLFRRHGAPPDVSGVRMTTTVAQYEVFWFNDGVPQLHYFEGWRLT